MNSSMTAPGLACDYDETLASAGNVPQSVIEALTAFRESGGKIILVTGRQLPDLLTVCPDQGLFDFVVAENGAVLYEPQSGQEQVVGGQPAEYFVEELRARGVDPLAVGRSVVATTRQHSRVVDEVILETGVDVDIILNRSSLMILPHGINKGTGLKLALEQMKLPAENVVGVGDAENDAAFLELCGASAAVANALPAIKEAADFVTSGPCGEGVIEVINKVMSGELLSTRSGQSRC